MDVAQNSFGGRRSPYRRPVLGVRLSPRWKAATTSVALLFLAVAPAAAQVKPADPVIYPRGTASADTPAVAGKDGSSSSFYLAVALLLGAGGWWLWLKRKGGLRGGLAGATHLTIAETKSLGSRQYLVVADYDGKKYLLGVCPGSIELLTPLEGGEGKDA